MKVEIIQNEPFQFSTPSGALPLDIVASPALSGADAAGFRPMELLLTSLAGCMSIDVLNILKKRKQEVTSFKASAEGERTTEPPNAFTSIRVEFEFGGDLDREKVAKAIDLSAEKYCSVYHSLSPSIEISFHFTLL
ncbi:OsmC family protein [Cryomorphaceae bacterium]|nr:OsmC family protein [Cryomorphaceae bacterium]